MRYDIRILWVEDTPRWYNEAKEIINMDIEDEGLTAYYDYVNDGQQLLEKLQREQEGFKLYDIFFVDYALSHGVVGSQVIKEIRKTNMDSDILFYSSDKEETIRNEVKEDLGLFEGVYIANRENFREKSLFLLKKNVKNLLSLSNIRGLLTDQTSENDFIIISYLYKKFNGLSSPQKEQIKNVVLEYLTSKQKAFDSISNKAIEKIEKNGITNIKNLLGLASDLVPLELKYNIFQMVLDFNEEKVFENYTIQDYMEKIIKTRNTVAHKKLDICRMQKNILFYDNINQYCNRKCPDNCKDHNEENKISVVQWMDIRKQVIEYGKCFDAILNEILKEVADGEVAATIED